MALDAATGKLKWYFQTIHHDIWDYDTPATPTLVEVVRNGQRIPAVIQTCLLYTSSTAAAIVSIQTSCYSIRMRSR